MFEFKVFLFLALVLLIIDHIASSNINCDYTQPRITIFTKTYRCEVKNQLNITTKHSGVITSVNGTHVASKSNDDVACFVSQGNDVQYFPQNLQNIFKNLKRISIQKGRLRELNQDDIKPFPQLTALNLVDNDLIVLEDGLFDYNMELTVIDLERNKIVHIGQQVFVGLANLTFLDIRSSSCIDLRANNNSTALEEVIRQSKANCTDPEFVAIERGLMALEDEYSYIVADTHDEFIEKIVKFRNFYENSTFMSLSSVRESIEVFDDLNAQPAWLLKKQIKQLEKAIIDSNRNMMTKIEGMSKKSNLLDIASSDLSMWITGLVVVIVLFLVYKKTLNCYRFPVIMV